ncbi:MAG: hypothetical protein ACRC7O_04350 [Fimbriiglobus sp.]
MRTRLLALIALISVGLAANPGRSQDAGPDVRYWALREITFPVPVDKFQAMNPRPAKLRFYVAPDRGQFKVADERALKDLETIDPDRSRKGFRYASPADGEYDFALQFVYADGDTSPRDNALGALYRVVFDTRPPVVNIAALGTSGVEWAVQDENPDQAGVQLEVRWQGSTKWTVRNPRPFALRDKYSWRDLNPAQPLEVRVVAKDKAGHEMPSRVVTLPTTSGVGLGPDVAGGVGVPGSGYGDPPGDGLPARPQIDYVNTRDLTIQSKLTRVTRSGVKSATLWVSDGKSGWRKGPDQPLEITPATPDPTIRIPYSVAADGLYGFIVIPVNGAGGKQDDPRVNDPAQFLIEVDTEKPYVKVNKVDVTPGGALGPRVELQWDARDKNLMPDPIVLEYSPVRAGGEWLPIASKIPNTGRYVWEVEDKNLWRFFVRARAVDKAANSGEDVYAKEVIIDLEKPQAVIDRVHGGAGGASSVRPAGGASVRESERPPVDLVPGNTTVVKPVAASTPPPPPPPAATAPILSGDAPPVPSLPPLGR